MVSERFNLGVIDNRLLSRSIGYLEPCMAHHVKMGTPVKDVLTLMVSNSVSCVTVVDLDGRIVGIFSDRDVVSKIALSGIDLEQEAIDSYMTVLPHTAYLTSTVAFVLSMMSQGGYRHVPIVDEFDKPVALIGVEDIVDYIVAEMDRDVARICEESSVIL